MTRREKNWEQEQRRRKAEGLLMEAWQKLHWPHHKRFQVSLGHPDYTIQHGRSHSRDFKVYLTVGHFWLETVHEEGLVTVDKVLVLDAVSKPQHPPAEAVWDVTTLGCDSRGVFSLGNEVLIRYGGKLFRQCSVQGALERAVNTFHSALTGIDEPPF